MDEEQAKAFASFDSLKAQVDALHGHADRLGDSALTATVAEHHAELQATWTEYLTARGWAQEAGSANRSGGENKGDAPDAPGTP